MQNRAIHSFLIVSAVMAVVLALFASESRLQASSEILPEFFFSRIPAYSDAILNLASGYSISVVFYFIVVYIPQRAKQNRIRKRALRAYRSFKIGTIDTILQATDGTCDIDLAKSFLDPEKLDQHFSEDITGTGNRWYDFKNGLSEQYVSDLILELEILKEEISHVISNVEIEDEKVFDLLKNVSASILSMRRYGTEYDEQKAWANFLRSMLSPHKPFTNERIPDPIENALKKI